MPRIIPPLTEDENRKVARELFETRRASFSAQGSPMYDSAKNTWYLLAVLAGCLDQSKVNMDIMNELNLRLDEAQANELVHRILTINNPAERTKVAEICVKLHKLICGRCACH